MTKTLLKNLTKPVLIKELVERRELSQRAAENMRKSHVTNTNELYCLIKSAIKYMPKDGRERLATSLGLSEGKLRDYMEFIEPYVSEQIINSQEKEQHPTGCLVTNEQMERIKWINSLSPEEYEAWQIEMTEKFYKEHPEYR
jgi:hypothetical protein